MTFPCQLGLEYNPPTPFGEGAPFVQGIMSLYELGVEFRVNLAEAKPFASVEFGLAGSAYTLQVQVNEDGYSVTARDREGQCKQSFFPLRGRGRHWDTRPD